MEFINQHRRRLENFTYNVRVLFSGSSSEIPLVYFGTEPTDLDFMMYCTNVCAVPKNSQPPRNFVGEVLTIDPQGLSAGYVTLENSEKVWYTHLQKFNNDNPNGPALKTPVGWSTLTFDSVFSVQCPYWPPEAEQWQTRHRFHDWPSKDLIDQIVSEGSFLVGKSHPSCKDDYEIQWRYSFSKAEMRLISSWTDSQKYVYHVLRLIKSNIVKKRDDKEVSLCTYHLKTQMFWACEEKAAEFWEDCNLLTCVFELLTEMIQRLTDRNFPNYFIPDCNLIEGKPELIEDDLREAVRMLNTESGRSYLKSQLPPKLCHECRVYITLPVKMAPFIHLYAERYGMPFQANRPKLNKVQELINEKMDDLVNGIYSMQLAKTLGGSYYAAAEHHFRKGIAYAEAVSNNVEVKCITLSHSASSNAVTALFESLENAELRTLGEGENQWDMSMMIKCTKGRCPYAGKSWNFPWSEEYGNVNEKWMHPTHLISAAYLCNLYFITGNYEKCIKIVNEQNGLAVNAFNTELFPLIFCPELASLFDENIQEVLGLLWLFKYLRGGERIFEFCTCPQLFMLYIRIQSSLRLDDFDLFDLFSDDFNNHCVYCKYRFYLYPHHYVLFKVAWHNRERRRAHSLKDNE